MAQLSNVSSREEVSSAFAILTYVCTVRKYKESITKHLCFGKISIGMWLEINNSICRSFNVVMRLEIKNQTENHMENRRVERISLSSD